MAVTPGTRVAIEWKLAGTVLGVGVTILTAWVTLNHRVDAHEAQLHEKQIQLAALEDAQRIEQVAQTRLTDKVSTIERTVEKIEEKQDDQIKQQAAQHATQIKQSAVLDQHTEQLTAILTELQRIDRRGR